MEEDIQNYSTCFVGQPVPYIYVDTENRMDCNIRLIFQVVLNFSFFMVNPVCYFLNLE